MEIGGKTLREKLEDVISSRSHHAAPEGFIGATERTKGAMIRRVISSYREKAKSQLLESVELIQAERRGGAGVLREQYQINRNRLFEDIVRNPPEQVLTRRRRTFEDLLK